MGMKRVWFLLVFIYPCLLLSSKQEQTQPPKWEGHIKLDTGIRVITNSGSPLYGEIKLELKEELSIGREDDTRYLFYRIRGIAVDNMGNIFVDDMSNYRIQKFDQRGIYLQTTGRHGQGPSDFQLPSLARVEESTGNIFVKDYATNIVIFNQRGEHLKTLHFKNTVEDIIPNDDGTLLAVLWFGGEKIKHALCKINAIGEISNIFVEFAYPIYSETTGDRNILMTTGHEYALHIAEVDKNTIVYGYSKDYELSVIDKSGSPLFRVNKKEPIPKFTTEEKSKFDKLKKRIPLFEPPRDKPYFYGILTDSRGRIYVQRNQASETIQGYGPIDKEEKEVDVFNRQGYLLYRTKLPRNTYVIKNGYLYAHDLNEAEGLESVKRYKITNWEQLRY
jgi:hypothetical protein